MPIFQLDVEGYRPITGDMPLETLNAGYPQLWRIRHDKELGELFRPRLPEVHPFLPNHFVIWEPAFQRLEFSINTISVDKWNVVHGWLTAFNNRNGFGNSDDPRANYVAGTNLSSPLPKQECLSCGGAYLAGTPIYSLVQALREVRLLVTAIRYREVSFRQVREYLPSLVTTNVLATEMLDGRGPAPTKAELLAKPWLYFDAVTVDGLGTPRMFPQGDGQPVRIIFLGDLGRYPKPTIPLWKLEKWDMTQPLVSPYVLRA